MGFREPLQACEDRQLPNEDNNKESVNVRSKCEYERQMMRPATRVQKPGGTERREYEDVPTVTRRQMNTKERINPLMCALNRKRQPTTTDKSPDATATGHAHRATSLGGTNDGREGIRRYNDHRHE